MCVCVGGCVVHILCEINLIQHTTKGFDNTGCYNISFWLNLDDSSKLDKLDKSIFSEKLLCVLLLINVIKFS